MTHTNPPRSQHDPGFRVPRPLTATDLVAAIGEETLSCRFRDQHHPGTSAAYTCGTFEGVIARALGQLPADHPAAAILRDGLARATVQTMPSGEFAELQGYAALRRLMSPTAVGA